MREIKFRAWDNDLKKFFKMFDKTLDNQLLVSLEGSVYETGSESFYPYTDYQGDKYTLMQYTGLKDKNGKEIYFGDILKTENSNPEFDIWTAEDYGYALCYEAPDELGVRFKNWCPTTEEDSIYNFQFVEIIGNIYENPELLK